MWLVESYFGSNTVTDKKMLTSQSSKNLFSDDKKLNFSTRKKIYIKTMFNKEINRNCSLKKDYLS